MHYFDELAVPKDVAVSTEHLTRFPPIAFDPETVALIEQAAERRSRGEIGRAESTLNRALHQKT